MYNKAIYECIYEAWSRLLVVLPASTDAKYINRTILAHLMSDLISTIIYPGNWTLLSPLLIHIDWLKGVFVSLQSFVCNAFCFMLLSVSTSWALMWKTKLAAGTKEFILNHVILQRTRKGTSFLFACTWKVVKQGLYETFPGTKHFDQVPNELPLTWLWEKTFMFL